MAKEAPTHIVPFETNPFKIMVNGLNRLFNTNSNTAVVTIVAYYALNIISYTVGLAVGTGSPDDEARRGILNLGVGGISVFLGLIGILLALQSLKGEKVNFKGLFQQSLHKFLPFLGYSIILALIYVATILIGIFTLFIPFVLAIIWLGYTLYVKLDQNLSLVDSMKESRELVRGRGAEFIAVSLIASFIGAFGGPALQAAIMGEEYMQLKVLRAANPAEKPPINKICYWLIVAVVIVIGLFIAGLVALIMAASRLEQ